jgi:prolyl oligopeptidase
MHARKMCAALQHGTSGPRPILIRAEGDVGHGARALSRSVTLSADTLSFSAACTGLRLGDRGAAGSGSAAASEGAA